jgi:hypothetical protein
MSFTNPQRIINKQFDSFVSGGQNLTNNIATSVEQMRQQVAKQKEYTKKLEDADQQEGFQLRSKLNELGTTGNRVLDENIQAFWNEKVDDYFKIKNAMQDGTITKQEGNRGLSQIMALVPQFKRQVEVIGAQSASFKEDAANGNVSSIGSIENKSFLKRAGAGGNIGIVERGGDLYFFAPEEDGEPASMINGNELLTMENSGQNMYQTKPNLTKPGEAIFNAEIQPDSLDSEHVEYIQVKKGDINPVTGKPFTNLEDGKIYTYRTITQDKKQGAIDAMQKSPAISSMIGNDNLMKRVWQDEIPDEEIERIATELNLDTSLYKDGWHEYTEDMSEDQVNKINSEQNQIMKTYLANKFYNDNATMDNTLKFVKEEVINPEDTNEETGDPYYMDTINDTMLFFENPAENENLLINHSVNIGGKNYNIAQVEVDGDKIILKDEDYKIKVDSEDGEQRDEVVYKTGTFNMRDDKSQLALAQALQRASAGNNKENNEVVAMFRRLYPEVYNKRKLELDKQKQAEGETFNTKNKPGGGVFKDLKAYETWKKNNPLTKEAKQQFSLNPDLIAAHEALKRAKASGDKALITELELEFKEIEYTVYQDLLAQQVMGNLQ